MAYLPLVEITASKGHNPWASGLTNAIGRIIVQYCFDPKYAATPIPVSALTRDLKSLNDLLTGKRRMKTVGPARKNEEGSQKEGQHHAEALPSWSDETSRHQAMQERTLQESLKRKIGDAQQNLRPSPLVRLHAVESFYRRARRGARLATRKHVCDLTVALSAIRSKYDITFYIAILYHEDRTSHIWCHRILCS